MQMVRSIQRHVPLILAAFAPQFLPLGQQLVALLAEKAGAHIHYQAWSAAQPDRLPQYAHARTVSFLGAGRSKVSRCGFLGRCLIEFYTPPAECLKRRGKRTDQTFRWGSIKFN